LADRVRSTARRKNADAERREAKLVLQPAELGLNGGATGVMLAEPLAAARDERAATV